MASRSKAKTRDMRDATRSGLSPGAAALAVLATALAGMVTWNAFMGDHRTGNPNRALTVIPQGATTHVVVEAPAKPKPTVTITYSIQVEAVQRELAATGHFRGLVDGVMGKLTANAIRKYQADNDLPVTGAPGKELLDHIRFRRKVLAASEFTGSLPKDKGLPAKPRGKPDVPKPAPLTAADTRKPKETGLPLVREVQQRLKRLGYEISLITGEPDDELRSAVLLFQMEQGLSMDGVVGGELMSALKIAEASRSSTSGE
jgi:peptidoglycan hydrolase-like protein with peptidoglycan-binding domain